MRTHPAFYVGCLRPYHQHEFSSSSEYSRHSQEPLGYSLGTKPFYHSDAETSPSGGEPHLLRHEWPDALARSPIKRTKITIGRPIGEGGRIVPKPPKRAVPASLARRDHADLGSAARTEHPPP